MKKPIHFLYKKLFFVFVYFVISTSLNAQKNYILEVDRLHNTTTFKQKTFDAGRPSEKVIKEPSLRYNDILTVRMINFNELIYGLEIDGELHEKTPSVMNNILSAGSSILRMATFSPSLDLLSDLMNSENEPITRGGSAKESTAIRMRFVNLLVKLTAVQTQLQTTIDDEGLSKEELVSKLHLLEEDFDPSKLIEELSTIKEDWSKLSDDEKKKNELSKQLQNYKEEEIEKTAEQLHELELLAAKVDFKQEVTLPIEERTRGNYDYYKVLIRIYKRANPLQKLEDYNNTIIPYSFSYPGKGQGDRLNETIPINVKIAYKQRLYFSVGVSKLFVPNNTFSYSVAPNITEDSFSFSPKRVGGTKVAIGLFVNYDLPVKSDFVTLSANLGYNLTFEKSYSDESFYDYSSRSANVKKGYVTTGFGIKFKKLPYLSVNMGAAWSRFEKLSDKYKAGQMYEGTPTAEEVDAQISKVIKPALYAGLAFSF